MCNLQSAKTKHNKNKHAKHEKKKKIQQHGIIKTPTAIPLTVPDVNSAKCYNVFLIVVSHTGPS